MVASIAVLMGGRVAEKIFLGDYSSGAGSDLRKATNIAQNIVYYWGMDDKTAPMIIYEEDRSPADRERVKTYLRQGEQMARQILEAHRDDVELLTKYLMEREELSRKEIDELLENGSLSDEETTAA